MKKKNYLAGSSRSGAKAPKKHFLNIGAGCPEEKQALPGFLKWYFSSCLLYDYLTLTNGKREYG